MLTNKLKYVENVINNQYNRSSKIKKGESKYE